MRQLGFSLLLSLALLLAGTVRADLAHQEDTALAPELSVSGTVPGTPANAPQTFQAERFWRSPLNNLPATREELLGLLSGSISHRQAWMLRAVLETDGLADWQREAISERLTLYSSDLSDRERVPAPGLSEAARSQFLASQLRSLPSAEVRREIAGFTNAADELLTHAPIPNGRTALELTRLASSVNALRGEEARRNGVVKYRAGDGAEEESEEAESADSSKKPVPPAKQKDAQINEPAKPAGPAAILTKRLPVGGSQRSVHYIDPSRWQKDDTVVIVADYNQPGIDNPGGGIPGALANSVASFQARGIEVLVAGSPEAFDRAAKRVQERAKQNPKLKVILNAHGQPGKALFGQGFELTSSNAKQMGEKLKGVGEIFMFSCSFGGVETTAKLLAEGAQTHVMASTHDMYAEVGKGDSPGVRGISSILHAYPETDKDGKKIAEADIQNPKFVRQGILGFDPDKGPHDRNQVIDPDGQIPPGSPPPPPDRPRDWWPDPDKPGDRSADGRRKQNDPNKQKNTNNANAAATAAAGGSNNPGVASANMPVPGAVPEFNLPPPPAEFVIDASALGARRSEPAKKVDTSPLVYAPPLPVLRKPASTSRGEL